jgi:hypothetical protein
MNKLSLSELYAAAAAVLLLLLALLNNAWLMLAVSIVGLVAGLIIARKPAPEGQEGMLGSLRRAGLIGLVGFGVALVFAIILLTRG